MFKKTVPFITPHLAQIVCESIGADPSLKMAVLQPKDKDAAPHIFQQPADCRVSKKEMSFMKKELEHRVLLAAQALQAAAPATSITSLVNNLTDKERAELRYLIAFRSAIDGKLSDPLRNAVPLSGLNLLKIPSVLMSVLNSYNPKTDSEPNLIFVWEEWSDPTDTLPESTRLLYSAYTYIPNPR